MLQQPGSTMRGQQANHNKLQEDPVHQGAVELTASSAKGTKKERQEAEWQEAYEAYEPPEYDYNETPKGEREYPFYMICTLKMIAIDQHDADIEVYLKLFWRFHDLKGAIERGQLELWDPEGAHDSSDALTEKMKVTGISEGTIVRGALPRRKGGAAKDDKAEEAAKERKGGAAKDEAKAAKEGTATGGPGKGTAGGGQVDPPPSLFHADPPISFKRPFDNQVGAATHVTPCWTAYDEAKQVLSCQVHLKLKVEVPHPDLARYPIDRRAMRFVVGRRRDKSFGKNAAGKSQTCSTQLLVRRPDWVKFKYSEDNCAVCVKWPNFSSSRKLPLDLRKRPAREEVVATRGAHGEKKTAYQGVFVYRKSKMVKNKQDSTSKMVAGGPHYLLVLMERNPTNFLWNIVLPNSILVLAAHSVMFMEFYNKSGLASDNNKSLLHEQVGISLAVLLATMANKFVALQQELPGSLPFTTLADKYFVLSYLWVTVLTAINTVLYICVTHWNWTSDEYELDSSDPNIDDISSKIGYGLSCTWLVLNLSICWMARAGAKRTSWKKVVQEATRKDEDAFIENQNDGLVNNKGELDGLKLGQLDK